MIRDLVLKNRSYRRFHENTPVEYETLKELVDLARHSASAANLQPLKYVLSCDPKKNDLIFSHLAWAAYLKDWPGPAEGERPAAYVRWRYTTKKTRPLENPTRLPTPAPARPSRGPRKATAAD